MSTVIIEKPDTIQTSEILLGFNQCAEYIASISARPIGAKTIQIYTQNKRIPVFMKAGINTIFLKSHIREWNNMGRPNMQDYEAEKA